MITETSRGLDNDPELGRRYYYAKTRNGLSFHVRQDAVARLHDRDLVLYAFRSRRGLTWDEAVARAQAETREP